MFLGCSPHVKIVVFLLPRLVYMLMKVTSLAFIVFVWLRRIEPNSTTLYDPRIRSKSEHPWVRADIFPVGATRSFAYPFQVADDAIQMDVHKRFTLSTPLVCAG